MRENELLKLSFDIGCAGLNRKTRAQPDVIFQALTDLRPENACGAIGMSLVEVGKGNFDAAITLLKSAEANCTQAVPEAREVRAAIEQVLPE